MDLSDPSIVSATQYALGVAHTSALTGRTSPEDDEYGPITPVQEALDATPRMMLTENALGGLTERQEDRKIIRSVVAFR